MKILKFFPFGRAIRNTDLKVLQEQIAALESNLPGDSGPYIIKGCAVTPNGSKFNVAPGWVYLDGKVLKFDGVSSVDMPIELIAAAPVESDSRKDKFNNFQNTIIEYKATWQPASVAVPGGGGNQN